MDDPAVLYVSDDPEGVRAISAILFHGVLPDNGDVARILIDHDNRTPLDDKTPAGVDIRVIAWIVNRGPAAGTIDIARSVATKSRSGIAVGHATTSQFLRMRESSAGGGVASFALAKDAPEKLIDVVLKPGVRAPAVPGKPVVLAVDGECITGLFDVQCDAIGNAYEIRVIACDPSQDLGMFDTLGNAPGDGKQRSGVFAIAGAGAAAKVAFGEVPLVGVPVSIGRVTHPRTAVPKSAGPPYEGEFGITKRFTCAIQGGDTGRTAMIAERAGGGGAMASYMIDGKLFASQRIGPADEFVKVTTIAVGAHQSRTVSIATIAEINSTMPIDILIAPNVETVPGKIQQLP